MEIRSAKFISSHADLSKLPSPNKPEYAFIGRSNVGKSSLINMLCEQKYLAKTSSTPGKTQTINHFLINEQWYLVDLPGYGFAKVAKTEREKWKGFSFDYIKNRKNLLAVCVLIDVRLEPQKIDQEFMNWLGRNGVPFMMIFTKCDKLTKNQLNKNYTFYQKEMLKTWEEMPVHFLTSAVDKKGKDEVLNYIDKVNLDFKK